MRRDVGRRGDVESAARTVWAWAEIISPHPGIVDHQLHVAHGQARAIDDGAGDRAFRPGGDVVQVDASRQSNRVSANVSGFLGTTRISLNDNLLKQGTSDEVLAAMGHEMGHYVMGHITRDMLMDGLVIILGFAFANWGYLLAVEFFGGQWQVRKISEVAGLPLLMALASLYLFLATPLTNSMARADEQQADIFGLDAVRKPDAFASVILKLSTYRKLEPGKWEEMIFYDHPSGRTRIETAMRW